MTNILLCGGSGTRLWPISREHYPKQFSSLIDERSLFQDTLLRNKSLCKKTIIVTNEEHYNLAKTQVEELNIKNIEYILEPVGRNTAPAITLSCMGLDKDEIVFVTPSDHYIKDEEKYKNALTKAKIHAEENFLVTFGIKPSCPETGFGYIQSDGENVISFHEKPNVETAQKYLDAGNYYWNSGMFAFKAGVFLEELKLYSNEIYKSSEAAYTNKETKENVTKIPELYIKKIPANSIDYAVMEKSKKIKIIAADMKSSDLGSFEAIYENSLKDENGNVTLSNHVICNAYNNLIVSEKKMVALIDVEDLIIIESSNAILISKKGSSQNIKELLPEISKIDPDILKYH